MPLFLDVDNSLFSILSKLLCQLSLTPSALLP